MIEGTLLAAVLLGNGFTVAQVTAVTSIGTLATTVCVAAALVGTRALERRHRGRLVVLICSAAALAALTPAPLVGASVVAVCAGLVALRTASGVFSTHRSLLIAEWAGVAKGGQHLLVVGLLVGLVLYLTRAGTLVSVLNGANAGSFLSILVLVATILAATTCAALALRREDRPTPPGNRLGSMLSRLPSRAVRARVIAPTCWLLCPAVFATAYAQAVFVPVLVDRNGDKPYQLAALGLVGCAGVAAWIWLLLRSSVRLVLLPQLGLLGAVATMILMAADAPPAAVAFAAGIALAGMAAVALAGARHLARTANAGEATMALTWVVVIGTISVASGLMVAVVVSGLAVGPDAATPGILPFVAVMLGMLTTHRLRRGHLAARGLIRLWLRQVTWVLAAATPQAPVTHGDDVGRFVRTLARQAARYMDGQRRGRGHLEHDDQQQCR